MSCDEEVMPKHQSRTDLNSLTASLRCSVHRLFTVTSLQILILIMTRQFPHWRHLRLFNSRRIRHADSCARFSRVYDATHTKQSLATATTCCKRSCGSLDLSSRDSCKSSRSQLRSCGIPRQINCYTGPRVGYSPTISDEFACLGHISEF